MKVLYGVLLTVGLCFCAAGAVGHTAAWAAAALCFLRPQWLLWDSVIRGKVDTGKNKSLLELYLKSDRIYGGEQKCSMKKVYC